MSYLWCEFATRVAGAGRPTDIHWAAVRFVRMFLRARIVAGIGTDPNSMKTVQQFIDQDYQTGYRTKWLALADRCAKANRVIRVEDIMRYWTPGRGDRVILQPKLAAEAAETIGGQMWFRFTIGARRRNYEHQIPVSVITRGRAQSCGPVHRNSGSCVDGDRIDFSKWDWDGVSVCSFHAGRLAGEAAATGGGVMTDVQFEDAWCKVWRTMREKHAQTNGDGVRFFSNAC